MATITISAGGKEGAFRGDPGVYTATLLTHSLEGPFDSKQKPGETFKLHEWGFSIEGAPDDECMVWMSSGESTGPKSKTFGVITALAGKTPDVGISIDTDRLLGRQVLLDIRQNDKGYLDAVGIMPLPKGKAAAPKPAPSSDEDLPF